MCLMFVHVLLNKGHKEWKMSRKNPDTHLFFLKSKQEKMLANLAEWLWMTMTLTARIHYVYVNGRYTDVRQLLQNNNIQMNSCKHMTATLCSIQLKTEHKWLFATDSVSLVPSWMLNGEFGMFRHNFNVYWNTFQTSHINHHVPSIFGEWIHFSFVLFILFVYSIIHFFGILSNCSLH